MRTPRRPGVVAWSTSGATAALLATQAYYVLGSGTPLLVPAGSGLNPFPLVTLGTMLGAAVGALVAARHPRNPVGWLFCAGMLGTAGGLAAEAFSVAVRTYDHPAPDVLVEPAMVVGVVLGSQWAMTLLTATFLVFPDGRLPSPRWRPVLLALPVPLVVTTVVLVGIAATGTLDATDTDPDFGALVVVPLTVAWLMVTGLLAATAWSLVRRLRRADGVLRQQLRWLATSAFALVGGVGCVLAAPSPSSERTWAWVLYVPLYVAFAGVPVAAGVAVLRYRLYDIDLVINRAVLLGVLVVFATVGYVGAVVTLGGLLGSRAEDRFWPSLLATATVALAFQPLRRGVERFADRLAYGARAAPYEALAGLARRMGESPDPDALLPSVAEAAAAAVGARAATVRLVVPGGAVPAATWPAGAAPLEEDGSTVAVSDDGDSLGSVTVATPPGAPLRPPDQRLLGDLADQCALAFRNARLTAELAERVAELDRSTEELAESRRRLIDARDAERSRLESAICRDVTSHLTGLPRDIGRLAAQLQGGLVTQATAADDTSPSPPGPPAPRTSAEDVRPGLAALSRSTDDALARLRDITRGIFPAQLARSGLVPALSTHLGRLGDGATLTVDGLLDGPDRFEPRVEAAVYSCVAEAARVMGPPVEATLSREDDALVARVRGRGPAAPELAALRDRVESVGGAVGCEVVDGRAVLQVRVPVPPSTAAAAAPVDSQTALSRSGPNADLAM